MLRVLAKKNNSMNLNIYRENFHLILTQIDSILVDECKKLFAHGNIDLPQLAIINNSKNLLKLLDFELFLIQIDINSFDIYEENFEDFMKILIATQDTQVILNAFKVILLHRGSIFSQTSRTNHIASKNSIPKNEISRIKKFIKPFLDFTNDHNCNYKLIFEYKENYKDFMLYGLTDFRDVLNYIYNCNDKIIAKIMINLAEFGINFDIIAQIFEDDAKLFNIDLLLNIKSELTLNYDQNELIYALCGNLLFIKAYIEYITEPYNYDMLALLITLDDLLGKILH